jgi:hypothetical protein
VLTSGLTDNDGLQATISQFFEPISTTAAHVLAAIDAVLLAFWFDIGAMQPMV